jgi:hypothetical protein
MWLWRPRSAHLDFDLGGRHAVEKQNYPITSVFIPEFRLGSHVDVTSAPVNINVIV